MSYPDPSGGYPPPPRDGESQYPPPPGEEDDRNRAYQQRGPPAHHPVTLPSISPYDPQYAQPPQNGYAPDPRAYQQQPPPHPQDAYRGQPGPPPPLNGPYRDDRGGYQQDYGRGGPQPQQHMAFAQSAPRQRTAIACRYCRRRKIRCSGFDQNPEGRCSNCQRFQQECIFTPVSSQAQAFVPAHAVYPNMRGQSFGPDGRPRHMQGYQGTQLYGAHGQPLGPVPPQSGPPYPQTSSPYSNDYAQPSPTSSYTSFTDDRERGVQPGSEVSRKRPQQEPHPSILPPPMPGQPIYTRPEGGISRRPAAENDPRLPPITPTTGAPPASNSSPGSSTSSRHSGLQPPPAQPGHASHSRTPPPRASPSEATRDPVMSFNNILEQGRPDDNQHDRRMLSRLDGMGKKQTE